MRRALQCRRQLAISSSYFESCKEGARTPNRLGYLRRRTIDLQILQFALAIDAAVTTKRDHHLFCRAGFLILCKQRTHQNFMSNAMPQSQTVLRGSMNTPIGELLVFTLDGRVIAIEFRDRGYAEARIRRFLPQVTFVDGEISAGAYHALQDYFETGRTNAFQQLVIEPFGSSFQLQVWDELRKIPTGTVTSYGKIATAIGRPGAFRAVGAANGQNPIPIIIPCHRVIGSDRSLTGYGSGLDRKQWLLWREGFEASGGKHPHQGVFPWAE